jgi:SAM-dependent methyltransferase
VGDPLLLLLNCNSYRYSVLCPKTAGQQEYRISLSTQLNHRHRFEVDDANLPLSHYANSFDLVHARSIDHGIYNYEEFINSAAEVLRPGGVLLLVSGDNQLYAEDRTPLPYVEEGEPGYTALQKIFLDVINAAGYAPFYTLPSP